MGKQAEKRAERSINSKRRRKTGRDGRPVGHGGNCAEGDDEGSVGIGAAVLPPSQGRGQEIGLDAVGLRNDGGEAAVREERVGGAADTDGVVVAGLVGEGSPLRRLVDAVRLQHEAAFRAHRVSGRVVEHHLRMLLAVPAVRLRHLPPSLCPPLSCSCFYVRV